MIDSIKNFLTKINMSPNFKKFNNCKLCNSKNLIEVLNLADLPIGDKYMPEEKVDLAKEAYELRIMMCQDCNHYQNSGYVDPDLIYGFYLSRPATTNPDLAEAFKDYADYIVKNFSNKKQNLFAVEAGSNNGIFIQYMKEKLNIKVLGVEPSNLYEHAINKVDTINDYFNSNVAKTILNNYGQADFLIANHTFSNIIDNIDFLKGVKTLLKMTEFSACKHFIKKQWLKEFT